MDWMELPLEPRQLRVPSWASKMILSLCYVSAQTVHLSCTDTNTISKWTKMIFHMTHITLEFHREHPTWFLSLWYVRCKSCTNIASRLALCPNGLNWASTWALSPRSIIGCVKNDFWAYGTFGANRANILHRNEIPHDPSHLVVTSRASKMISEPVVCSAQSVHLSCFKISTISKRTESSFHLSLVM
jgi:hypothetical protein